MSADSRQTRPPARWRRPAAALAVALACAGPAAAPAAASPEQNTIFDATSSLLDGQGATHRTDVLDRLEALGVDTLRAQIRWRLFVPDPNSGVKPRDFDADDPGDYPNDAFKALDDIVREAEERGISVLLTPTSPIPDWAGSTGNSATFGPEPDEYGDFVTALGRRYSGTCVPPDCPPAGLGPDPLPRVDQWAVWNEPNLRTFLRPQRLADGRTVSGNVYRRLWFAAQRALKVSGHAGDEVLIGETAPSRGSSSTAPLKFQRQLFCLSLKYLPVRECEPIVADGWSHHPYNPHVPPWRPPDEKHRGILSIGSMGRLTNSLRRVWQAGATEDRLPVYITEYGIESLPEDRYGVSLQRQAEFLGAAEYLLYRNPQVLAFAQYLLDDDEKPESELSFQTGLRFHNGTPKPSYQAFPVTLVVRRLGNSGSAEVWGHVRPGVGFREVSIRVRDGEDEPSRALRTVETDIDGYFSFLTSFRRGREWRATTSLPDGRLLKGPFVRSYRFD
ncbi:MAG: hypothetical protein AABM29_05805 [Actinomycetota bacterium]